MIEAEANTQHVAAHIGDAALGHEVGTPALGLGTTECEEAGVVLAVERVEQLGAGERSASDGIELSLTRLVTYFFQVRVKYSRVLYSSRSRFIWLGPSFGFDLED